MNDVASILLVVGGGAYFVLGALHALYTYLDIGHPRRIVPGDLGLIEVLKKETIRLAGTGTTFWRGWIGFNFSHSLGALLFSTLCISGGLLGRSVVVPHGLLLVPILIGGLYALLAVKYWFRIPIAGTVLAEACFAGAYFAY